MGLTEQMLDEEKINYKQVHTKYAVIPVSKRKFVDFFDLRKETEARDFAKKTGGTLKKIDQIGRVIKEMNKNLIEKAFDSLTKNTPLVPVTIDETVIHITELSKSTLSSYAKKAADNLRMSAARAGFHSGLGEYKLTQASIKQAQKRQDGVKKAVDKLTKEDVEAFVQTEEFNQLDELSKATLGSYIKKASKYASNAATNAMHLKNTADMHREISNDKNQPKENRKNSAKNELKFSKWSGDATDSQHKRLKNIDKAVNKLTKEDIQYLIDNIDQLDESERYQLAQIALREDYTAKGNIYHGGETHKFKVTYGDFPSHKSIQEQNPHLKKHHVDAVMNHFEEHGDDDMTNTESEHEASGSEVHVHHNSGSY